MRAAVSAAALLNLVAFVSPRVPTECGAEAAAEPFWNRHAAKNSMHIIFIFLATLLSCLCLWAAAAPQQRPQRLWVDADGSVEIIVRGHTAIPLMLLVVVVVQRAHSRGVVGSVRAVTSHTLRVSALARPITKALRVSAKEAAKRCAAAASGNVLMMAMVMIVAELLLLLLGSRFCGRVTAAGW